MCSINNNKHVSTTTNVYEREKRGSLTLSDCNKNLPAALSTSTEIASSLHVHTKQSLLIRKEFLLLVWQWLGDNAQVTSNLKHPYERDVGSKTFLQYHLHTFHRDLHQAEELAQEPIANPLQTRYICIE